MNRVIDQAVFSYSGMPIDSRMHIIIGSENAIAIDSIIDEDALKLLKSRNIRKVLMLLTHEHYDHIAGVNWWKSNIETEVLCSEICAEQISDPRKNLSQHYDSLFMFRSKDVRDEIARQGVQPYRCFADRTFRKETCFSLDGYSICMTETPGHSKGSCCILVDEKICFTGDTLLLGTPTITRFPGGSKRDFELYAQPYLKKLSQDCLIYPGHGNGGSLRQFIF